MGASIPSNAALCARVVAMFQLPTISSTIPNAIIVGLLDNTRVELLELPIAEFVNESLPEAN